MNPENKKPKVSYLKGIYDTNPETKDLSEILEDIKNGKWKSQIENLRSIPKDKEDLRKETKSQLENFLVSGVFENVKDESIKEHSGLIQIDFDHIDNPIELKAILSKDLDFIYSAFISPSGNGLKLIVKIPPNKDLHKGIFLSLEKLFMDKYKLQIDKSCKNLARRFFVSYDPELYLNESCNTYKEVYLEKSKPIQANNKNIDLEQLHKALDSIPVKQIDNNEYDLYRNLICSVNTLLGYEEAFKFGNRVLAESTMETTKILEHATVTIEPEKVIYGIAKSYGFKYSPSSAKTNNDKDKTINTLVSPRGYGYKKAYYHTNESWLNERYDFMYNVVKNDAFFKQKSEDSFKKVEDIDINNLLRELEDSRIKTSKDRLETSINSNYATDYDPFKEYLEKAKAVTTNTDCELERFYNTITGKSHTENLQEFEAVKTWFASAVGLALGHGSKVKTLYCLCFHGDQGSGKTSLFDWLVPKELSEYRQDNLTDYESKDTKIALSRNFLILLDELGQSSKHDLVKLKPLITQSIINERLPWGRRESSLIRRASFVGTIDNKEVFSDPAGNRRYIIITIQKIDWNKLKEINFQKLWGQAYLIYESGNFSKDIDKYNIEIAKNFEKPFIELELLQDSIIDTDLKWMTSTEILLYLKKKADNVLININKVGNALKQLGYEKKAFPNVLSRYKGIKGYYIGLKKSNDPLDNI